MLSGYDTSIGWFGMMMKKVIKKQLAQVYNNEIKSGSTDAA
jgi:hypothetical protein